MARRSSPAFVSLAVALALAPPTAVAAVHNHIATGPARSRAHPAGDAPTRSRPTDLPISHFGDREGHDLYCPHALEPSPLVVIVPDGAQSRDAVGSRAQHLASAGFIVVVVDPVAGAGRGSKLGGMLDALAAADPLEPREAGCRLAPGVAAWGIGSGAAVALELAAARAAAGKPLSAVVLAFGTTQLPSAVQATPTLAIAGVDAAAPAAPPPRWQLVVEGAAACDLDNTYCGGTPREHLRGEGYVQASSDLSGAIDRAVTSWLRAHVEADPVEVTALSSWQSRISFQPDRHRTPPDRRRITQLAAPLVLGRSNVGGEGGGSFLWGFRPEVGASWTTDRVEDGVREWSGHSAGGYAEILRAGGDTTLGGGLAYVYTRQPFGISPSIGLFRTWADPSPRYGVAASIYVGLRYVDDGMALPFGARIEFHRDLGSSSDLSILLSLEADLVLGLISLLGATSTARL